MDQIRQSNVLSLPNPHLNGIKNDHLYHLGLTTNDNLEKRFGDVKFLCMGGKKSRMQNFAQYLYDKLDHPENCEFESSSNCSDRSLKNISEAAGRYALFKVGPVLSASHGIGAASMSVIMHELLKLMYYAKCKNVIVIRIGTSGGLGVEPGTVIVTNQAYNGLLKPHYELKTCGKTLSFDSKADKNLAEKIVSCATSIKVKAEIGNSMYTDDFYEEQARLDGALCTITEDEKMEFLNKAHNEHEIRNIEMECACFIGMCNRAKVKYCTSKQNANPECNSAIGYHLLQSSQCAAKYREHQFFILDAARSRFHLNLLKATDIKIRHPTFADKKTAVVCVALIDRLQGDGVTSDIALIKKWEEYPQQVVAEFIKQNL